MKNLIGFIEFENIFTLFNNRNILQKEYNKKYTEMSIAFQKLKNNEKAFTKIHWSDYEKFFKKFDLYIDSKLPIKYRFISFYVAPEIGIGCWIHYKTSKNNDFSNNNVLKMMFDDFLKLITQENAKVEIRDDI